MSISWLMKPIASAVANESRHGLIGRWGPSRAGGDGARGRDRARARSPLREVISHLLTVLDPLAAWYLLTRSSFISTDLRAQGQAVDGPDDEVSSSGTKRSSISLRKIIPTDTRDLGCSGVAWPEQRPPALRSSSSAAPAAFANKNTFFRRQSDLGSNQPGGRAT